MGSAARAGRPSSAKSGPSSGTELLDLALEVPGGAPASIPQPDYSNLRVSSRLFFGAFFIKTGDLALSKSTSSRFD